MIFSFLKQQQLASGMSPHPRRPLPLPPQEKCHQRGERPPAWVRWIDAPGNWAERASEQLEDAVSVRGGWMACLMSVARRFCWRALPHQPAAALLVWALRVDGLLHRLFFLCVDLFRPLQPNQSPSLPVLPATAHYGLCRTASLGCASPWWLP